MKFLYRSLCGIGIFFGLVFVLKVIFSFYHDQSCQENIAQLRNEICDDFSVNKSIGNFCHDLCISSNVKITGCPNYLWHNGKDFVVTVEWRGRKAILKARNLKDSDPFGADNEDKLEKKHFLRGLADVLSATFVFNTEKHNAERFTTNDLIPWGEGNVQLAELNRTSLLNLWLLAQDNEYILSKVLGSSAFTYKTIVFPKIIGTCGHFYLVEFSDEILDFAYVLPSSAGSMSRSFSDKLQVSIELMEFLATFERLETGFELCDVKFEHFGRFYENGNSLLRMIDSDMIYHKETAREAIAAIKDCSNNRDCDFVDCEGECLRSESSSYSFCQLNPNDNNLKRICRNMLFMGKFNFMGYETQMGLLPGAPVEHEESLKIVKEICSKNTFSITDVNVIQKELQKVRNLIKT